MKTPISRYTTSESVLQDNLDDAYEKINELEDEIASLKGIIDELKDYAVSVKDIRDHISQIDKDANVLEDLIYDLENLEV